MMQMSVTSGSLQRKINYWSWGRGILQTSCKKYKFCKQWHIFYLYTINVASSLYLYVYSYVLHDKNVQLHCFIAVLSRGINNNFIALPCNTQSFANSRIAISGEMNKFGGWIFALNYKVFMGWIWEFWREISP